jgi:pyrimidine-nucleoside phosphorylase
MLPAELIRRKRYGGELSAEEIEQLVGGITDGSVSDAQVGALAMAIVWRDMTAAERVALTGAMTRSGEVLDWSGAGLAGPALDKHSTGGVGDKVSLLLAPIVAACGGAVPMISGRGLGHTGGTLDKLEAIPGFRTALSLAEFEAVLARCGCSIVSQTPALVPADRVLYALRDRTGTVESPGLICASILSKKLAAGLDALVLDVKTGSGAFLPRREDAEYLAALMVTTAEAAGTRTVALMTDMGQPLGSAAGNWIELVEAAAVLDNQELEGTEDLRELSITLAGWIIFLGGKAASPEEGYGMAEGTIVDGSAVGTFLRMVEAQGGNPKVFDDPKFHRPGATRVVEAPESGHIASMDTTMLGWAVQRTGAGREKAGEPVDPHAGIHFHARRGAFVEKGQPLATLYATHAGLLADPVALLEKAIVFSELAPEAVPLVSRVFTRAEAEAFLNRNQVRIP